MADYISTLTGVAMDSALLDMAEHTSEAYAVGERNGVPVDSGDVTYHNNARYYAQQAQSIAPASVTEAVRWDVAQTALTDAQRLQGRENIKATSHNYNLLDNGWFTVNQRGVAVGVTVNANNYIADRWQATGTVGASRNADGTITINNTIYYKLGDVGIANKTVTLSALYADGSIESTTFNWSGNPTSRNLASLDVAVYPSANQMNFSVSQKNVRAIKLELGSFSTLAYDTPPDYGKELTRCIYSTADPNDTYANNGFGRSNRNLLDNPFFTINQRSFTTSSATNGVKCVDRWYINSGGGTGGSTTLNSNGTMTLTAGSSYQSFQQTIETVPSALVGRTMTISVMLSDGTVEHQAFVVPAQTSAIQEIGRLSSTKYRVYVYLSATGTNTIIPQIYVYTGQTITIRAVKLELGSVSTLANDMPPNYAEELAKCKYYFNRVYSGAVMGSGWETSATNAIILLPVPMMRAMPTVSATSVGTFRIKGAGGTSVAPSAISGNSMQQCGVCINATISGGTMHELCCLAGTDANAYIDLSADL